MARDKIQEILGKNERNGKLSSSTHFVCQHIRKLKAELLLSENYPDELLKYFHVALIASIETVIRNIIKEIVDGDSRYSDNISKLDKIKLDMDILKAVSRKEVSLGDFISHLMPLNSLDAINKTLSTLLEVKFLSELKEYENSNLYSTTTGKPVPPMKNPDKTISDLKEAYRLRNIYAHEIAPDLPPNREKLFSIADSVSDFVTATIGLVSNILYPSSDISNAERKERIAREVERQESKINEVIDIFTRDLRENEEREFKDAQNKWLELRELESNFWGTYYGGGGTLTGLAYLASKEQMTSERLTKMESIISDKHINFHKY